MLDLDVGFLESPRQMVRAFMETPIVDIFVQVSCTTTANNNTATITAT